MLLAAYDVACTKIRYDVITIGKFHAAIIAEGILYESRDMTENSHNIPEHGYH